MELNRRKSKYSNVNYEFLRNLYKSEGVNGIRDLLEVKDTMADNQYFIVSFCDFRDLKVSYGELNKMFGENSIVKIDYITASSISVYEDLIPLTADNFSYGSPAPGYLYCILNPLLNEFFDKQYTKHGFKSRYIFCTWNRVNGDESFQLIPGYVLGDIRKENMERRNLKKFSGNNYLKEITGVYESTKESTSS